MSYGIDLGSSALKVAGLRRTLNGESVRGRPEAAAEERRRQGRLAPPGERGDRAGERPSPGRGRPVGPRPQHAGPVPALHAAAQLPRDDGLRAGAAAGRGGEPTSTAARCASRTPSSPVPRYIGIAKDTLVDERVEGSRRAVDVHAVPNSFALYAAYKSAYGVEDGTILLLDIGSDNMDIAFVRGVAPHLRAQRVLRREALRPAGGRRDGLRARGRRGAEGRPGDLGPADLGSRRGRRACWPVRLAAGQLAGTITSSINHAKVQLNDRELTIDKVYLSGGGARLRGLPSISRRPQDPRRAPGPVPLDRHLGPRAGRRRGVPQAADRHGRGRRPRPAGRAHIYLAASTRRSFPSPSRSARRSSGPGSGSASPAASCSPACWPPPSWRSGSAPSKPPGWPASGPRPPPSASASTRCPRSPPSTASCWRGPTSSSPISAGAGVARHRVAPPEGHAGRHHHPRVPPRRPGRRGCRRRAGLRAAFVVKVRAGPGRDRRKTTGDQAARQPRRSPCRRSRARSCAGPARLTVYGDVDENIRGGERGRR